MAGLKRPISQAGPDVKKIATQIEKAISGDRVETVRKAAMAAKVIHNHEIAKKAGSDMKMSNIGRSGKGGRVGTHFNVRPKGKAMATGLVGASGAGVYWLEAGTKRHIIRSRYAGGSRESRSDLFSVNVEKFKGNRRAVINIPGVGYRRYADHKGSKAFHVWTKGERRARPVITKIMRSQSTASVKRRARLMT